MSWINKYLNNEDLQRIENAISLAEEKTSGEIVPIIVRRSSVVGHVPLMLTLMLVLLLVFAEFPFSAILWTQPWVYLWPVVLILIFVLSHFIAKFSWIQKVLVSEGDELFQVHQRAQLEFYKNKIHRTTHGTGMLIFVSVMEKKAVILGDQGISNKIPKETWDEILKTLSDRLNQGQWVDGFEKAIQMCGEHLKTHFPMDSSIPNELKNHLIIKD